MPNCRTIVDDKGDISVQANTDSLSASFTNHLCETVVNSLGQTGYVHHRSLKIRADEGIVFVEGILPTWFMRQVALECIKRVAGVNGVIDRIQVRTDLLHNAEPHFSAAVFVPTAEDDGLETK
jgi:osmotically-inducible protein OsmY